MTLLLQLNLGFAWGSAASTFNPALIANTNAYLGPAVPQPVTK